MNQKNKFLHIISGLGKGGAEKILYRLILNDQLFQHEVISLSNENFYKTKFDNINVSVKSLNLKRGKLSLVSIFKFGGIFLTLSRPYLSEQKHFFSKNNYFFMTN